MPTFFLEIITPERQAFSEEVDMVTVPTDQGKIGVLAHHASLFCSLTEGEIKITNSNREYYLAIGGGFMEVNRNTVSILVSRAMHAHELNGEEIKKAQAAARDILARNAKGQERLSALSLLRRTTLEMKVLQRRYKTGAPTV